MGEAEARRQSCPKCGERLLHVERRGMIVELCSGCRGLWFDPGELTLLLELYRKLDPAQAEPAGCACPRCADAQLVELRFPGTEVRVDLCPDCQGIWLDEGELELLRGHVEALLPADQPDLSSRARELLCEVERAGALRFSCPKCQAKLWHLRRHGTIVELCSGCAGMWFDAGELTVLLGVYRRLEAESGQPTEVACVRCGAGLTELSFPGTSVRIDACPGCQGIWLDAGEFEQLRDQLAGLLGGDEPSLDQRAREILDGLDLAAQARAACPKCGGRLEDQRRSGVHAERCAGCGGTWLDSGDLTRVLGVSRRIRLREAAVTQVSCIRCPGETLRELPFPGTTVPIDTCPDCRGTWLDAGEVEQLIAAVHGG